MGQLNMVFSEDYLAEIEATIRKLDASALELLARSLAAVRQGNGRLFVIGLGGGASLGAHAVSDLRMMADFEAYAPTDNVTELTARINDYGWNEAISGWLRASRLNRRDALLVFSVGGGNIEKNVSVPLVNSMAYAREIGAAIYAVVGPDGGTARDTCCRLCYESPSDSFWTAEAIRNGPSVARHSDEGFLQFSEYPYCIRQC
jgi:D-sedoheptulose 7-phosphate isomerase